MGRRAVGAAARRPDVRDRRRRRRFDRRDDAHPGRVQRRHRGPPRREPGLWSGAEGGHQGRATPFGRRHGRGSHVLGRCSPTLVDRCATADMVIETRLGPRMGLEPGAQRRQVVLPSVRAVDHRYVDPRSEQRPADLSQRRRRAIRGAASGWVQLHDHDHRRIDPGGARGALRNRGLHAAHRPQQDPSGSRHPAHRSPTPAARRAACACGRRRRSRCCCSSAVRDRPRTTSCSLDVFTPGDLAWLAASIVALATSRRAEQRVRRRRCLAAADFAPSRGLTA